MPICYVKEWYKLVRRWTEAVIMSENVNVFTRTFLKWASLGPLLCNNRIFQFIWLWSKTMQA